jgi:hypothetical protein
MVTWWDSPLATRHSPLVTRYSLTPAPWGAHSLLVTPAWLAHSSPRRLAGALRPSVGPLATRNSSLAGTPVTPAPRRRTVQICISNAKLHTILVR